jgi:DNA-binding NarL/FixJ family response regulator
MTAARPTLLVVTDVRVYRDQLIDWLSRTSVSGPIAWTSRDADLPDQLHAVAPDVVLLDVRSRDRLRTLKTIAALRPSARIVVFGVDDDERDLVECAEAGVSAYVPAEAPADELLAAIQTVARGDLYLPAPVAAALFRRLATHEDVDPHVPASSPLTGREHQILALVVQGLTNKEIAASLHIEVATVKNHVHSLLLKLQVKSRAEAAARVKQGSRSWMQTPDPHLI